MALQLSANRKKAVNRKSCRKIPLSSEERKYVQKKVGLLARASLYSEALPDRITPDQWHSSFHPHLQLRKQLRISTEFPVTLIAQHLFPA